MGVLVERVLWDIDAYSFDLRDKFPDGQDRELLFGGRLGIDLRVWGVDRMRLDAFGGFSIRRNRQYVRFTGDLLEYTARETNLWLDLRLAWAPDRGEAGSDLSPQPINPSLEPPIQALSRAIETLSGS